MSLVLRNVTGDDLIALADHINKNEPIEESTLKQRFFSLDLDDVDTQDELKTLNDAVTFLQEAEVITATDEGLELSTMASEISSLRLAILQGIRGSSGDSSYDDILVLHAMNDSRFFDHKGELLDELQAQLDSDNWKPVRAQYWTRVMSALGVVTRINTSTDMTTLLSLDPSLSLAILNDVMGGNDEARLRKVLNDVDTTYLPVYKDPGKELLTTYLEAALVRLDETGAIRLQQVSDYGEQVRVGNEGYEAIEIIASVTDP
jgi:hypothetical protein